MARGLVHLGLASQDLARGRFRHLPSVDSVAAREGPARAVGAPVADIAGVASLPHQALQQAGAGCPSLFGTGVYGVGFQPPFDNDDPDLAAQGVGFGSCREMLEAFGFDTDRNAVESWF